MSEVSEVSEVSEPTPPTKLPTMPPSMPPSAPAETSVPLPDPFVRDALAADVPELVRLAASADAQLEGAKGWAEWRLADAPLDVAQSSDAFDRWISDSGLLLVSEFDGVVVGFLAGSIQHLHEAAGTVGRIDAVFVEPEARSVGCGDALLNEAVARFQTAGCVGVDGWALPGERETKNFFEAHAFTARRITVHHSFEASTHGAAERLQRRSQRPSRAVGVAVGANEPRKPQMCVGAVIVRTETDGSRSVLLIRRAQAPQLGRWSLPGGRVEPGESLIEAVQREVREETGLLVVPTRFLDLVERISDEHHFVIADYLVVVEPGALSEAQAGTDADAAQWVDASKLAEMASSGALADGIAEFLDRHEVL